MDEVNLPPEFTTLLDAMKTTRDHVANHRPDDAIEAIEGAGEESACDVCHVIEDDITVLLTSIKTAPGQREDERYDFVLNELDALIAWYEEALEDVAANA